MNTDTDSGLIPKLPQLQFGVEALGIVGEIDGFRGAWPLLSRMTQERLAALEARATTEAAGAASRLEGLSAEDTGRYGATLAAALDTPAAVSADWISSLHRTLLDGEVDAGAFKTEPNAVEAFDADGKSLGAIFAPEKPENVTSRLTELTAWLEGTLAEKDTHPAVTIGLFAASFLEIHPFRTGTIRLVSVLTTALLVRAGYGYARYGSLDRAIEGGKYSYYLSLRRSLGALRTGQPDWKHWLDFFLRALRQQKRDLEARIAEDRAVSDDLPGLSAQILAIALEHGRVTIATAATATVTSRNTIKDHVGRLVEQGHLTLHGAGRGAWYGLR
jgi:Fic family protein